MSFIATKTRFFRESIIRNMSLLCREHQALNLAQGLPEDDTPEVIKQACIEAIQAGFNQYPRTWGISELLEALAERQSAFQGQNFTEDWVTICCGGTEAMMASFLATLDPGDEVLIPYPYYENYRAELLMAQAVPVFVPLRTDPQINFHLDFEALEAAITPRSKGIVLNTPHNPTGKVFTRAELEQLSQFCQKHNLLVYTDETYEYIVYSGAKHISPAIIPGMKERTIQISSISKTYAATGWRIAWAIAPPEITEGIRKVHDFLTIAAPHPMQKAAVVALRLPQSYYDTLLDTYTQRRNLLCTGLRRANFKICEPEGAYYVFVAISQLLKPHETPYEFSIRLIKEAGVASVPGTAFMPEQHHKQAWLRFSFCKKRETLEAAIQQLTAWSQSNPTPG